MHINVRDILVEHVGYSRAYGIVNERPKLATVTLTSDVNGEVTLARLDEGILAQGQFETVVELECHRCLRTFTRPVLVRFSQLFQESPGDEMPIVDEAIDLAPLIEQEIIVNLPIKLICRDDCAGVPGTAEVEPETPPTKLGDRARITKGQNRGRTQKTNHP